MLGIGFPVFVTAIGTNRFILALTNDMFVRYWCNFYHLTTNNADWGIICPIPF